MPIFRGSKDATTASGDIVATQADIVEVLNQAEAAKAAAESAQSAAETAETNAETAETNAETAETNAETAQSAAEAAQSAAETAESNAEASATAAATSETNAANSATQAATSATEAEAALDSFTDLYLGAKSSDPTVDNDGDPLVDGALYFDTTTDNLKVFSTTLGEWVEVNLKTDSEIRSLFSASGDLSYNATTGDFSVTTYKDADVEAYLSGGTGVTFGSGVISIGQPVGTSDSVTFVDAEFTGTGAVELPEGTGSQRPGTPAAGMVRFNSDTTQFEGYNGLAWGSLGGGATGGGSDQVFVENDQTVTADYTIPADKNAMTTGPIQIDDGVTVTVSDGARWVVI